MSQISSLVLFMMMAIMMVMIIVMVMLIMIMTKIMNGKYIWIASLNAMKIKISFAVAYDFNQLIHAVCSPPRPLPAPQILTPSPPHPALWGPIDTRPARLNCIFQDLFRDTALNHILRAQICAQI